MFYRPCHLSVTSRFVFVHQSRRDEMFIEGGTSHRVGLPVAGRAFRVMKLCSSIVDPESKLSYVTVVGREGRLIIGALCPSRSLVSGVSVFNIGDVLILQSECDPVKEMAAVSAPLRPQLFDQSPVAKTRK